MNPLNPKIKVYLAAPWKRKDEAKLGKIQLEEAGLEVTSRWIDLVKGEDVIDFKFFEEEAIHDVQDVYRADILILLNLEKSEGKSAEMGMALAWNKPVIIVGERSNIFHYLPMPIISNLNAAIELIRQWEADYYKKLEEDNEFLVGIQAGSQPAKAKEPLIEIPKLILPA